MFPGFPRCGLRSGGWVNNLWRFDCRSGDHYRPTRLNSTDRIFGNFYIYVTTYVTMNSIQKLGRMALGTRLRGLSDLLTEDARAVYALYEVPIKPKWFSVMHVLSANDALSITELAQQIGHSHPSVVKIVQEMKCADLVTSQTDKTDGRRREVALSETGREVARRMQPQYADVTAAVEHLLANNDHDLWRALDEVEYLLRQKSLYRRVLEAKKRREARDVQIVDYQPAHAADFRRLNQRWIEQYFRLEAADRRALDHPQEYILDRGGAIFVALCAGTVAGVCALQRMDGVRFDYELAKMAVDPQFQGRSIGYLLGQAVVERARELGARNVFLESSTVLTPALRLYEKLGFRKVSGVPSPYERSNIQMELRLD